MYPPGPMASRRTRRIAVSGIAASLIAAVPSFGASTPSAVPAYVTTPFGEALAHPSAVVFATDGDLIGQSLHWQSWGSATTTARGRFQFRTTASHFVYRTGSVTLYARRVLCPGRPLSYYYARARFHVPNSPFGTLRSQPLLQPAKHFICIYESGPGQ
jgi:hypothetical protein